MGNPKLIADYIARSEAARVPTDVLRATPRTPDVRDSIQECFETIRAQRYERAMKSAETQFTKSVFGDEVSTRGHQTDYGDTCSRCGGEGEVLLSTGRSETCPTCVGRGEVRLVTQKDALAHIRGMEAALAVETAVLSTELLGRTGKMVRGCGL
jgi:hypothetical protein